MTTTTELADKIAGQIALCDALGLKNFQIVLTPDAGRALVELLRLSELMMKTIRETAV